MGISRAPFGCWNSPRKPRLIRKPCRSKLTNSNRSSPPARPPFPRKLVEKVPRHSGCGRGEASFPLTPALSLGERENHWPRCDESRREGIFRDERQHPLPEGEGRVRGDRAHAVSTVSGDLSQAAEYRAQPALQSVGGSSDRVAPEGGGYGSKELQRQAIDVCAAGIEGEGEVLRDLVEGGQQ
jgi:hypothetical protein